MPDLWKKARHHRYRNNDLAISFSLPQLNDIKILKEQIYTYYLNLTSTTAPIIIMIIDFSIIKQMITRRMAIGVTRPLKNSVPPLPLTGEAAQNKSPWINCSQKYANMNGSTISRPIFLPVLFVTSRSRLRLL